MSLKNKWVARSIKRWPSFQQAGVAALDYMLVSTIWGNLFCFISTHKHIISNINMKPETRSLEGPVFHFNHDEKQLSLIILGNLDSIQPSIDGATANQGSLSV